MSLHPYQAFFAKLQKSNIPVLRCASVANGASTITDIDVYVTRPDSRPDGVYTIGGAVVPDLALDDAPQPLDCTNQSYAVALSPSLELWRLLLKHAGTDATRYMLQGVHIADGKAYATDGKRAFRVDTPALAALPADVTIPSAALKLALDIAKHDKQETIALSISELPERRRVIHLAIGAYTITAKELDGTYPNVQRIYSKSYANDKCTISSCYDGYAGRLLKAYNTHCRAVGKPKVKVPVMRISDTGFEMGETGNAFTECRKTGLPFGVRIGADAALYAEIPLGALIKAAVDDARAPISYAGDSYTGLLMPIRL